MQMKQLNYLGTLVLALAIGAGNASAGQTDKHDHGHAHEHGTKGTISEGYFEDSQIQPRDLSDWAGEWQSVYGYLQDGTLDGVMAHKAEHGDKSAEEYRAYYEAGYKTDTSRILIDGEQVTFTSGSGSATGQYQADGYEVLTYSKGNRGVRYVFKKLSGDAAAPGFIQFSDHIIAPQKSGHYHLYWGDDRQALLGELDHWPTFYPAALSGEQIASEMMAH